MPPLTGAALFDHQRRLGQILLTWRRIWHPQPHRQVELPWCAEFPALHQALLALNEQTVNTLSSDNHALLQWMIGYLPELAELAELIQLPGILAPPPAIHWTINRGIPGRKLAQIEAMAAAIGTPVAPLLEWCAGKGHLGRCLSQHQTVLSLDHDLSLAQAGQALSRRIQNRQAFIVADALGPTAARLVSGRHTIALHACGDLHLALIDAAGAFGAAALDIAPCCYHRTTQSIARSRSTPGLALEPADLRLAVTETITAPRREDQMRKRESAWKFAFAEWRGSYTGQTDYRPLAPIPGHWDRLSFIPFQQHLAARENITIPKHIDWTYWEQRGWERQQRTERLTLPRFAFRRGLEIWLVLERAEMLLAYGYQVSVAPFCERRLTPRNLLISARQKS